MIDIQLLRNDLQNVATRLATRGFQLDVDKFSDLEQKRKLTQIELENIQKEINGISKAIAHALKNGLEQEAEALKEKAKTFVQSQDKLKVTLSSIQDELNDFLMLIPNLPDLSVPVGKDEKDNVELWRFGTPKKFNFKPKDHVEIGENIGLEFKQASLISGSRFAFMKGKVATLHRAIAQLMLDVHINSHNYQECQVPYIVHDVALEGTGQLPKFEQDLFHVIRLGDDENKRKQYLIPTAEVSLTNSVREQIIPADELPIKLTAQTPCFRSEAGSYGKDTRGLIRQHQFDKVEMVQITHPDKSYEALAEMIAHAEKILQLLELPYRVILLCTGDMGFSASMTYDLEVWMPSQETYREISSCSNCESFQSRRMKTRFKDNNGNKGFVHTLNGSGLAVGRTLAALLENHQNEDGTIYIPQALRRYLSDDFLLSMEKVDNNSLLENQVILEKHKPPTSGFGSSRLVSFEEAKYYID